MSRSKSIFGVRVICFNVGEREVQGRILLLKIRFMTTLPNISILEKYLKRSPQPNKKGRNFLIQHCTFKRNIKCENKKVPISKINCM